MKGNALAWKINWVPCVSVAPSGMQTGLLCSSISNKSEIGMTREDPPSPSHTSDPASYLREGWPSTYGIPDMQFHINHAISRLEKTLLHNPS